MAAADVFCLPSYREGFGSVIIEAAAAGIPAIASKIYGITDAIEEGKTGLLHEPGNIAELTSAMLFFTNETNLRFTMGEKACKRAREKFSSTIVTEALLKYYRTKFNEHNGGFGA